jgi:hypothetical protein
MARRCQSTCNRANLRHRRGDVPTKTGAICT